MRQKNPRIITALCERERAPFAVIGEATQAEHLILHDSHSDNNPIDLPMNVLIRQNAEMTREFFTQNSGKSIT